MKQNQNKKREKTLICLYNCPPSEDRVLEAILLSSKKKPFSLFHYLIFSESNILSVIFALFVKLVQNKKKSKKKYQANGRGSLGDWSRDS